MYSLQVRRQARCVRPSYRRHRRGQENGGESTFLFKYTSLWTWTHSAMFRHFITRMHSSRMRTARSLTVSHRILRMAPPPHPPCNHTCPLPEKTTHPPRKTTHAAPRKNHACPPKKTHMCNPPTPCMPPKEPHMPPPRVDRHL